MSEVLRVMMQERSEWSKRDSIRASKTRYIVFKRCFLLVTITAIVLSVLARSSLGNPTTQIIDGLNNGRDRLMSLFFEKDRGE